MEHAHIVGNFKQLSLQGSKFEPSGTKKTDTQTPAILQHSNLQNNRPQVFGVPQNSFTIAITATPHSAGSFPIEMRKKRKNFERTAPYGIKETVKARKSLVF